MQLDTEKRKARRNWVRTTPLWKLTLYSWGFLFLATFALAIVAAGLQEGQKLLGVIAVVSLPFGIILPLWSKFMFRKD